MKSQILETKSLFILYLVTERSRQARRKRQQCEVIRKSARVEAIQLSRGLPVNKADRSRKRANK